MATPLISIITPVLNEEDNLARYEQAVREVFFAREDYRFEVILLDDGSTDASWAKIEGIAARDSRFRGIRLSRNFGSHTAITAGMVEATGDAVATLACDLQDPPEVVLELVEKWRAGAQIVWGKRRSRQDSLWRVFSSGVFERLLRSYAMPKGSLFCTGSFLLIDRLVADCFRRYQESNRITFALVAWTGFEQATVEYDRKARQAGVSGWNLRKAMGAMYDAFMGFSPLPAKLMTRVGVGVFLLCIPLAAYVVQQWWTREVLPGWSSLMLALAILFGLQFLLMGLMGEYLYRIYMEVVRRPLYFVARRTPPGPGPGVEEPEPAVAIEDAAED